MNATTPLELFREDILDADLAALRALLAVNGWQTREQICKRLQWSERKVRAVVELGGTDIVRGQAGFKLTEQLTREDLSIAAQAADAAVSQGKKMICYGVRLKRRIHEVVG